MPVRIYEIAKKLNLESKVVLAKARELGIHVAKVPSSSLDKITAEYLEQQMTPLTGPAPAVVAPAEPIPVLLIPAPDPEPEPQMEYDSQQETTDQTEYPGTPQSVETAGSPAAQEFSAEAAGVSSSELESASTPAHGEAATPGPGEPGLSDAGTTSPGSLSDAPSPAIPGGATVPASPTPPRPGLGEKIGSIDLSKFSYRRPGTPAPADPRARDVRPDQRGTPPGRPGQPPPRPPAAQPGGRPAAPGAPQQPARPGGQQQFGRPGSPQQSNRPGGPGGRTGGFQSGRPGGSQQTGRPGPYQRNFPSGPPRPPAPAKPQLALDAPVIVLRPPIIVRELAEKMGRKPFQIIADLMQMGVFATVTQTIDAEAAIKVCAKNGFKFETEKRDKTTHTINVPQDQKVELDQEDLDADLQQRPPVVTIMGHVDHGKTSLLDVIRKSNVVSGEAGGITQHIGAYTISYPHPARKEEMMRITFLDTPGHAAFSAMRARGARVTDIVVLVVAANDGVMPQTLEALAHAQAAKVPIIVAVNKCDLPASNPMRVKQQLQDRGLVPDDWGGDTLYVECSAITKLGVDKLIENILLQAELMELKANAKRNAKGNVIESGVEPGGPVATVLVRKGTLHIGDVIICGEHYGRVRAMMDEDGQRLKEAGPSDAVRVLGLNGVPEAGFEFSAVDNEKAARELAEVRGEDRKRSELDGVRPRRSTLEDIFTNIHQMSAKILKVIVKADTQGSVEAICEALRKTDNDQVQLEIIHSAVGAIKESDVYLASSADAVILGFHSRVDSSAAETAKREGVQIKLYAIIYELIDHVKEALAGLLDPLLKETIVGQAEVRKVFELSKGGNVAGCAVTTGRLVRGKMRVRRRTNVIYEGVSQTLKRFQDDVNEVRAGLECGIRLEGFNDFQEGDLIECYSVEKIAQKLT